MKTLWSPLYYTKAFESDENDHVITFSNVAPFPHDHGADVSSVIIDILYLRSLAWNAASLRQMFNSRMYNGEDAVKEA